jgi:hypothetical protein
MRYQRTTRKGSRPEGLEHPRATKHTAESYRARYVEPGPNASFARLRRLRRMQRHEAAKVPA